MLVELNNVLGLIEEMKTLTGNVIVETKSAPDSIEKQKALEMLKGKIIAYDSLTKLLHDPRFRTQ